MIRPGRERLAGMVEVDESYLLVVMAAEEDGRGIGRIRLRHIPDASSARLIPFIEESVEPGSTVHTDGWYGYLPLRTAAYQHRISNQKGHPERASELLPRVHQIFSLLKRWVVGNAPGICRRTSSGLSKRIRVSLQPPQIAQPRQTLLPPGTAGRRNRTDNLQKDCGLGHQTEIAQTQPIGGT
jgi:hypothetical protein